ncbi:MAG: hypothetical protein LBT79_02500 [Elusimicrobiota bacterium]|jgi:hypothetical protein|nr:hypothetical protein [Elusimicrobiota bacterium]
MKSLDVRLAMIKEKIMRQKSVSIMILGLGSVGNYLLDYLISYFSQGHISAKIIVVGRDINKLKSDVNIIRVSSLIRDQNRSHIFIESDCDFNNIEKISNCIQKHNPDFIINSSRVYSGLKYGNISWNNLRAYGIWAPLAISYIRNIMFACDKVDANAVVINTSYSDAVIAWLKTAGKPYPDFGSGNVNHLIPRIKFAVAQMCRIEDFWNIDIRLVASHFHDVVISKEGHCEKIEPLLQVSYKDNVINLDTAQLYNRCKIEMPNDTKRNMMNASSNFSIIISVCNALLNEEKKIFYSPGALGYIGGYPVCLDGKIARAYIDESAFKLKDMIDINKKSIACDGIESIDAGALVYTDFLIEKVLKAFNVKLLKSVSFNDIDDTVEFIIERIIKPNI